MILRLLGRISSGEEGKGTDIKIFWGEEKCLPKLEACRLVQIYTSVLGEILLAKKKSFFLKFFHFFF